MARGVSLHLIGIRFPWKLKESTEDEVYSNTPARERPSLVNLFLLPHFPLNEMKELPEKHLQPGQFTILLNNHQKLLTLGLLFGISEKQYRPIASQKLPPGEFH